MCLVHGSSAHDEPKVVIVENKCWAVIFTCMVTRAVYIEVLEYLSSSNFVNVLRRSTAICKPVPLFWSDKGTNFIRAWRELKMKSEDPELTTYLQDQGNTWMFTHGWSVGADNRCCLEDIRCTVAKDKHLLSVSWVSGHIYVGCHGHYKCQTSGSSIIQSRHAYCPHAYHALNTKSRQCHRPMETMISKTFTASNGSRPWPVHSEKAGLKNTWCHANQGQSGMWTNQTWPKEMCFLNMHKSSRMNGLLDWWWTPFQFKTKKFGKWMWRWSGTHLSLKLFYF